MNRKFLSTDNLSVALAFITLLYVGFLGSLSMDLGYHWEEVRSIQSMKDSIETGLLLPGWYNYPSISYDIALIVSAPKSVSLALAAEPDMVREGIGAYLSSHDYNLFLRDVFFLLSMATGLVVYLLVTKLAQSAWTGLLALLLLTTSWEIFYHARWLAPDGILMLFVAWAMLSQYQVLQARHARQRLFRVVFAAVMAGVCIGVKYPGGIVLVPLMLAIVFSQRGQVESGGAQDCESQPVTAQLIKLSLVVTAATFFVTTPGALLEPDNFVRDVLSEVAHYREGHGSYTVAPGFEHASKLMIYLVGVAPSQNFAISVGTSLVALVGSISLLQDKPKLAIWLLSLPVFYVLYMSTQHVLIVRNLLLIIPFLAIFAALGVQRLIRFAGKQTIIRAFVVVVAAGVIAFNLNYLTTSSLNIMRSADESSAPSIQEQRNAVTQYLAVSPDTLFYASPVVTDILSADTETRPTNLTSDFDTAQKFIFGSEEVISSRHYIINVRNIYQTVWSR